MSLSRTGTSRGNMAGQLMRSGLYHAPDGYHTIQPVVNQDKYGETHIANGVIHTNDGKYHPAYDLTDADLEDTELAEALRAKNPTKRQQEIIRDYYRSKGLDITDSEGNPLSATMLNWKYGGMFTEGLPSSSYITNTKATACGKNKVAFTTGGGIRVNK